MKISKRQPRIPLRLLSIVLLLFVVSTLIHSPPPPLNLPLSFDSLVDHRNTSRCSPSAALAVLKQPPSFIFRPTMPVPKDDPDWVSARRRGLVAQAIGSAWRAMRQKDSQVSAASWAATLFICGRGEEYGFARELVRTHSTGNVEELGGLLSSFQLTGDKMFLDLARKRAVRVARSLGQYRKTPKNALRIEAAEFAIALRSLSTHESTESLRELHCRALQIAEQAMESGPLSLRKGAAPAFARSSRHIDYTGLKGLWKRSWEGLMGMRRVQKFHGDGKEVYEGLLKLWLHGGKCDERLGDALTTAMSMLVHRVVRDTGGHDIYLKDVDQNGDEFDGDGVVIHHSMCYLVGVLNFGAMGLEERTKVEWEDLGETIARSCIALYERASNGLGGDTIELRGREWHVNGAYDLRPDLAEMLFYLWRFTKDVKYRETAWQLFVKIEKYCRAPDGSFVSLKQLQNGTVVQDTKKGVPDWYITATLRYIFLTFSNDTVLPLEQWLFNRRGDPLVIVPQAEYARSCAS